MKKTFIIISALLVVAWMAVIFFLSSMPSDESNIGSMKIANKIIEQTAETSAEATNKAESKTAKKQKAEAIEDVNYILRKFTHAGVYLILSILILNLFVQIGLKLGWKYILVCIVFCLIYAGTDEFHQSFVVGRTGQIMDVGIDAIGIIIGAGIFYLLHKLFSLRKREAKNV